MGSLDPTRSLERMEFNSLFAMASPEYIVVEGCCKVLGHVGKTLGGTQDTHRPSAFRPCTLVNSSLVHQVWSVMTKERSFHLPGIFCEDILK